MKALYISIISCCTFIVQAQESILPNLNGEALLEELVIEYKPRIVLNYSNAREYMYETLQYQKDTVEGVYTGFKIYLPPNEPSRSWTFNNGINAEHIYPRSKGASEDNGNAFSDLHHLKPAKSNVNSSRLNHPFKEIEDTDTKRWFRASESISDVPEDKIDEYSELDSFVTSSGFILGEFEPRESVKGDIARAVMYFYTMYRDEALGADPDFFESMREDLCQWHVMDAADSTEISITKLIGEVQDGKANPFVLDCSLALRSYCEGLNLQCADQTVATVDVSIDNTLSIYPNPSDGQVNINWSDFEWRSLSIYNANGQLVRALTNKNTSNTIQLWLPSGLYNVLSIDKNGRYASQRLIVIK